MPLCQGSSSCRSWVALLLAGSSRGREWHGPDDGAHGWVQVVAVALPDQPGVARRVREDVRVDAATVGTVDRRCAPAVPVLAHDREPIGVRVGAVGERGRGLADALVAGRRGLGGRVVHDEVVVRTVVHDTRRPRLTGLGPRAERGQRVHAVQLGPVDPVGRGGHLDVDRLARRGEVLGGEAVVDATPLEDARVREVAGVHGGPVGGAGRRCGDGGDADGADGPDDDGDGGQQASRHGGDGVRPRPSAAVSPVQWCEGHHPPCRIRDRHSQLIPRGMRRPS